VGEAQHLHACLFRGPIEPVVVARYEAAVGQVSTGLTAKVVALRLDAEAVEFALRRRGLGADLSRRMQILCYLVEVRPAYLNEFINAESSRARAWAALSGATLGSAWKLIKGEYLVRRYGLV
jgi:hypothetical protein